MHYFNSFSVTATAVGCCSSCLLFVFRVCNIHASSFTVYAVLTFIHPWSTKAMLPFMLISYFNFTVKKLTTKTDDRAWYEKLEDYEGDVEFVDEDGENGEQGKKNLDNQVLYS
jgi:hypothetical protein